MEKERQSRVREGTKEKEEGPGDILLRAMATSKKYHFRKGYLKP